MFVKFIFSRRKPCQILPILTKNRRQFLQNMGVIGVAGATIGLTGCEKSTNSSTAQNQNGGTAKDPSPNV